MFTTSILASSSLKVFSYFSRGSTGRTYSDALDTHNTCNKWWLILLQTFKDYVYTSLVILLCPLATK